MVNFHLIRPFRRRPRARRRPRRRAVLFFPASYYLSFFSLRRPLHLPHLQRRRHCLKPRRLVRQLSRRRPRLLRRNPRCPRRRRPCLLPRRCRRRFPRRRLRRRRLRRRCQRRSPRRLRRDPRLLRRSPRRLRRDPRLLRQRQFFIFHFFPLLYQISADGGASCECITRRRQLRRSLQPRRPPRRLVGLGPLTRISHQSVQGFAELFLLYHYRSYLRRPRRRAVLRRRLIFHFSPPPPPPEPPPPLPPPPPPTPPLP